MLSVLLAGSWQILVKSTEGDVKWILSYMKRTSSYGLLYDGKRQGDNLAVGYGDSDYAGDIDNKRSLTGYLFIVHNCTVSMKSTLQNVVVLSTTEAEYIAVAEAFKEAMWLKGMLDELRFFLIISKSLL